MTIGEKIEKVLKERLGASRVDVVDESALHAGHAEARRSGGGHFRVTVVSAAFEGKEPLARQRLVYGALAEELRSEIHALSMKTYTPAEWKPS